jgi:hypothetical protein
MDATMDDLTRLSILILTIFSTVSVLILLSLSYIYSTLYLTLHYPPINYYWTGLVGNLTNSKNAETKALEPRKS